MHNNYVMFEVSSGLSRKKKMYVNLSGRMSGGTHDTIHHYSNYDTEYKKLKTAYKFSI